jgi:glycosyltransferase involved in cell wall biosynthesis
MCPAGKYSRVAVLVPCHNEVATVAEVVRGFREALPGAAVYVYDNDSTDGTAEAARSAGAAVRHVPVRGKGHVVRRMFADIEAEVYLLVDGDATYDAKAAPELVDRLLRDRLDMVVGTRIARQADAYRRGHRLGNRLLTRSVATIFGRGVTDMLSGYRALSRRFVKTFPARSGGFETETEITIHALELQMPFAEVATEYGARPAGSTSKLSTWRDGLRIAGVITRMFKSERPLAFFSLAAVFFAALSVGLSVPLFETYFETGRVPRFPTAVLCSALMIFSLILVTCGLILDNVTRGRTELKKLAYLSIPSPPQRADGE